MNVHHEAWAERLASIHALTAAFGMRAEGTFDDQINALRQRQQGLIERSNRVLAQADRDGRELTADERRGIQQRTSQVEALESEIDEIDAQASQPQARLTPRNSSEPLGSGSAISPSAGAARRTVSYSTSGRFAELFGAQPHDAYAGRFSCLGEFGLAVAAGNDSRLMRTQAGMTEGTGAGGGFIVPPQFLGDIFDAALNTEVVRPRANVLPMLGKDLTVGVFDHQDGTDGKSAGLRLLWGAEATALTEQTGKVREMTLVARKGHIFVRVSNELASDGRNFDRQLRTAMIGAVASGLDIVAFQGTGAGQPLGILNSGALITVSKEGGQAASTLMLQNLAKMLARLAPRSYMRSAWFAHPTLLPLLYQMSVVIKNVAGTENVGGGSAAVTVDADGNLRIFGRPVVITDACSVLSSVGDIVLADFSQYALGLRADASIVRDDSVFFASDECAFRLILRLDGQPMHSTPLKLRDGTNTVSPFVTLEAR